MSEPDRQTGDMDIVELSGPSELDSIRHLWIGMHRHHRATSSFPGLVSDEAASWERRRLQYEEILDDGESFILVARLHGATVGYAAFRVFDGPNATFATTNRYAELASLSVDDGHRGGGIGTRLLDRGDELLAQRGAPDLVISVMIGNDGARRFYERRGLIAAETYLWRVSG